MRSTEVLAVLNEMERQLPVAHWRLNGVHVWPMVRIDLYYSMLLCHPVGAPQRDGRGARYTIAQAAKPLIGTAQAARAALADWRHNDRKSRQADVLILGNTADRTPLDGVWHDKIADPFIAQFEALQQRCLVLERTTAGRSYRVPRHRPSMLIQPALDIRSIVAALETRGGGAADPLHEQCEVVLKRHTSLVCMPSTAHISRSVARVLLFARFFERIIRRSRARVAFMSNYFDLAGMALSLACRRCAICSVEVQHGVQGPLHAAYGRWNAVPEDGYDLLPSVFWCWTADDASAIEAWTRLAPHRHRAIAGGNLWESAWRDSQHPLRRQYDARVVETKRRHLPDAAHDVLVTLQEPLYDAETIAPLFGAIRRTQDRWRWWLRQHPTVANGSRRLDAWLQRAGIANVVLDEATRFPLQALLPHMDVHVTHSSAAVMEAEGIGVPSVITSEYGEELFTRQLASGMALSARTADDIIRAIDTQVERGSEFFRSAAARAIGGIAEQDLRETLGTLLHCRPGHISTVY
jgi:hypothetical protein